MQFGVDNFSGCACSIQGVNDCLRLHIAAAVTYITAQKGNPRFSSWLWEEKEEEETPKPWRTREKDRADYWKVIKKHVMVVRSKEMEERGNRDSLCRARLAATGFQTHRPFCFFPFPRKLGNQSERERQRPTGTREAIVQTRLAIRFFLHHFHFHSLCDWNNRLLDIYLYKHTRADCVKRDQC